MKLHMSVPTIFLRSVRSGMKISAKVPGLDNQQVEGEVTSIDSRVDTFTRAVMVRAMLPSEQQAETRQLFWDVAFATVFTLFALPVAYNLQGGFSRGPGFVSQKLDRELDNNPHH